ncbi:MAG: methyltransferase domain-containing protein [Candidatus Heimdallarchaeota archaeon]|nr:MAG: methyltransferase domain-containing protein [Candidatus Heimdallarchaeota archaeon]
MTLEKNKIKTDEEGLEEILDFLRQTGIKFSTKSETRVIKRLGIMIGMHGFDNYFELLNLLQTDPQTRRNLIKWLERGKVFNEEKKSFIPLVQRDMSKEETLYTPKKGSLKKKRRNGFFIWENIHLNHKNDETWLDSERNQKKILEFLRNKKVRFTSKDETRILKRLKLIAKRIGFKNYSSLLKLLNSDPQTLDAVLNWLEKGRVYKEDENSFSPLVKRDTILQNSVSRKITKKKSKKKPQHTIQLDLIPHIPDPKDQEYLSSIYTFLSKNNINYEAYKEKYFLRRVHSRMMKVDAHTYHEYLNLLETDPRESNLLIDNLSINVTRFFRDKDLWSKLEHTILPKIGVNRSQSIRIWSAGCAVGPEPYSIAILMFDKFKSANLDRLDILATDLRQEFLEQAQAGVYSYDLLEEINPVKLQTYFKPITHELFQLSRNIREKVTFKKHDLRLAPPSRNFDIILCRNVLIYFSRNQAEKLFRRFYSALKPNGYLVLGKCELVPIPVRHLFKIVDSKTRIYKRN